MERKKSSFRISVKDNGIQYHYSVNLTIESIGGMSIGFK